MADTVAGLGIERQGLARQGLDKKLHGWGVAFQIARLFFKA